MIKNSTKLGQTIISHKCDLDHITPEACSAETGKVEEIPVPTWACTDSGSLTESLRSTKPVDKHPMRMHVERLKNHRNKKFVTGYRWVPTNEQMAGPLTKIRVNATNLRKILKNRIFKKGRNRGESNLPGKMSTRNSSKNW